MQLQHCPLSFLHVFLLSSAILFSLCATVEAFTVPLWTTGGNSPVSPARRHQPSDQKIRSVFPQLTWLRDTAIEKLFGIPSKGSKKKGCHASTAAERPLTSQLPATLLAKYGGDVVLRFNLTTPEEEAALAEAADTLFLDVWEFTSNWADIRLRKDDVSSLLGLLPVSLQKAHAPLMLDLADSIYRSYPYDPKTPLLGSHDRAFTPSLKTTDGVDNIFFDNYQPLSVIVPWMRLMASMFTTHVRMINIGTSYEGRDIPGLRVGVSPKLPTDDPDPRKTIIISGGSHAREWISVSTTTYVAWSLITSYGKNPAITKLLQEFDFVFIPTMNPDGYVYTWENDRLWRKNRQETALRFCRGLDLDRGFGFEWAGTTFESNPCSESYPGEQPFQAVESHRLAEWARNETEDNGVRFVGFLDLHSYSQQVLYPYSYSCNANPPSLENLEELGMGLAKAIRIASGEQYSVASACEGAISAASGGVSRMEPGGGSAIDWFYHELKVRYSYQIKLRDTGSYGFLLPKENIVPTGEEAYNALKYFGDFLLGNKGIESIALKSPEEKTAGYDDVVGEFVDRDGKPIEETDEYQPEWDLRRRK
ncbi:putative metallocarboxypeptidase ecm14 [Amylocarpus encephaloides]|uniref:Inactive metallocarboxypeptidase ECM14 n=1 Tax=Amylocarpus encephaloides TaxID=45428 RepID=A0A9P7YCU1_9HELO|nr:putative metallocarboxypeptidase ecm14 [Amylocarpus encephaloides]